MKKLGLIGCGYWGPNIIRNIMKIRHASLDFVVDKNPEVLSKLPTVTSMYDDLETALGRHGDVDGVIIATPISTHFELAKQVLEAGKHVLIQKPMTMDVQECDILTEMAKSKGLTVMVAHTFLFTGAVRKLKELVDSINYEHKDKPFFKRSKFNGKIRSIFFHQNIAFINKGETEKYFFNEIKKNTFSDKIKKIISFFYS